jgi:hypothetical protein
MIGSVMPIEWGLIIPSVSAASRPAINSGPVVTPGNNTLGSYVSLIAGASVTHDVYEIEICTHANNTIATARDALLTVGLDPAGGSSFTPFIEHLAVPMASPYTGVNGSGSGIWYRFPVFIKAGTSIGVAASVNNATVGTMRCFVILRCKPSGAVWAGSAVQTIGAAPLTSSGTTAITPGTVSEGAWAEIGTLDRPIRFIDFGLGINNGTTSTSGVVVDVALGDATDKRIIIYNALLMVSGNELMGRFIEGRPCRGAPGDKVYMRAQSSAAADAGMTGIIYGVY